MSSHDQRRLIESFIVRGLHPEDEMAAIAVRLGVRELIRVVSAAFGEAVDRKYGNGTPSDEDLRAYVDRLAASYGDDRQPVNAPVAEALIRAQLGEDGDLLNGLSVQDLVQHEILIAYDIVTALDLDEAGRNEFVDSSLLLLDEIVAH